MTANTVAGLGGTFSQDTRQTKHRGRPLQKFDHEADERSDHYCGYSALSGCRFGERYPGRCPKYALAPESVIVALIQSVRKVLNGGSHLPEFHLRFREGTS